MRAGRVGLIHVSVLREGLEQASQRDLLLVAKLSRKHCGRQIVVERVTYRGAEQRLVLVAELRIGEVESLGVRIVASEVDKVGDIDDEFPEQVALDRYIEPIVDGGLEVLRIGHRVPAQIGITAERFSDWKNQRIRRWEGIADHRLRHALQRLRD